MIWFETKISSNANIFLQRKAVVSVIIHICNWLTFCIQAEPKNSRRSRAQELIQEASQIPIINCTQRTLRFMSLFSIRCVSARKRLIAGNWTRHSKQGQYFTSPAISTYPPACLWTANDLRIARVSRLPWSRSRSLSSNDFCLGQCCCSFLKNRYRGQLTQTPRTDNFAKKIAAIAISLSILYTVVKVNLFCLEVRYYMQNDGTRKISSYTLVCQIINICPVFLPCISAVSWLF